MLLYIYTYVSIYKHLHTRVYKHLSHVTFPYRGSQRTSPSLCLPPASSLCPPPCSILPSLFAIWYPSKAVRPMTHACLPNPLNLTTALFCFFLIRSHKEPWFGTSGPSNRVTAWLCQLCFLSDSILIIHKSQKNWEGSRASTAAPQGWRLRTKRWPQISFGWALPYRKPIYPFLISVRVPVLWFIGLSSGDWCCQHSSQVCSLPWKRSLMFPTWRCHNDSKLHLAAGACARMRRHVPREM